MNINIFIGILLLVVALVLLYLGYTSSQSVGEQVYETFTGRFTDSTIWYLVFGVAAGIGGIVMLTLKSRA